MLVRPPSGQVGAGPTVHAVAFLFAPVSEGPAASLGTNASLVGLDAQTGFIRKELNQLVVEEQSVASLRS
jgi:hypothetical protein